MQVSQGSLGRVFVIRLEDGDRLPDSLERFAAENDVRCAFCALIGGADAGSRMVVGPRDGRATPPEIMLHTLAGVHEMAAVGTLFPDAEGTPRLHMHAAAGREDFAAVGCVRAGVDIWKVAEAVVIEMENLDMTRRRDPATGFELLTKDA